MNCIYWLQLLPYHDFQIGLMIFQLASFSSKINVYPKQVVYAEKNTVQIAYMKRFLHTYLKYMVICMIRKIFLSVLLNLHRIYNGWHWGNVVVLSCPIYAKYFSGSIARSRAMVKVPEARYRWYYRRTIRVFQIVLGSLRESEILLGEIC